MANIKDYANKATPVDEDKVIGTDSEDLTIAKNFRLLDLFNYVAGKISTPESGDFPVTGGSFNELIISQEIVIELTQETNYILPQISSLSNQAFFINIKNLTSGGRLVSAFSGDTIGGQGSQIVTEDANMKIYISAATKYEIV